MRRRRPIQRQPDLFATDDPPEASAVAADQPMLTALVSLLLSETVALPTAKEGNREDHL
jgi:hypothetical protein